MRRQSEVHGVKLQWSWLSRGLRRMSGCHDALQANMWCWLIWTKQGTHQIITQISRLRQLKSSRDVKFGLS